MWQFHEHVLVPVANDHPPPRGTVDNETAEAQAPLRETSADADYSRSGVETHGRGHGDLVTVQSALVTGGAGFIGSTLIDRLLADDWSVTAFDSLDESLYTRQRKLRHLEGAKRSPRFELIEGDTR